MCQRRLHFFFSSRRRHTRSYGDWSSDVCSSDLSTIAITTSRPHGGSGCTRFCITTPHNCAGISRRWPWPSEGGAAMRSEERRVGKEWRTRGGGEDEREDGGRVLGAAGGWGVVGV